MIKRNESSLEDVDNTIRNHPLMIERNESVLDDQIMNHNQIIKRNESVLEDQIKNLNHMIKLPSLQDQQLITHRYDGNTAEATTLVSDWREKLPNKMTEKYPHAATLLALDDDMIHENCREYFDFVNPIYHIRSSTSTTLYSKTLDFLHMNQSWFIPLAMSILRLFNASTCRVNAKTQPERNQHANEVTGREPRKRSGARGKDNILGVKYFVPQQRTICTNDISSGKEGIQTTSFAIRQDMYSQFSPLLLTEDLLSSPAEAATLKLQLVRVNTTKWNFIFQDIESLMLQFGPQICQSIPRKNRNILQQTISTKLNLFKEEQMNNFPNKLYEKKLKRNRGKIGIKRLISISHRRSNSILQIYNNLNYQNVLSPKEKRKRIRPVSYTIR